MEKVIKQEGRWKKKKIDKKSEGGESNETRRQREEK